jgi:hypothetical protein
MLTLLIKRNNKSDRLPLFYNNLLNKIPMGISFLKKKAIFTFRTAFSLSFAMKFQQRHWLEDFAWRVTQKFRLSSCLFPLCISLLCDPTKPDPDEVVETVNLRI